MTPANSSPAIKHLYSRAGFGISYSELQQIKHFSIDQAVSKLFADSKNAGGLSFLPGAENEAALKPLSALSEEEKKERIRMARQNVRQLNISWLRHMWQAESQLREKLTLFWHGHFACRSANPIFLQQLNNIHRKNAFGNFKTMLLEVSRSPAMLQFLNNQQNRKGKPNENFARELMELFTLGRGNYTEKDVKEAARAFTGWAYNRQGAFEFRPFLHDDGPKEFFGHTGNFDGADIIDQLLEEPAAAQFIARKLYAFLVSDTPNEKRIAELGRHFYQSGYEISALVKKILTADWFYSEEVIGKKIKSPVELLVGINRLLNVQYRSPAVLIKFQSALGQVLFYPPNVAGWAGGRNWIDSSSLMVRLKIPSLVLNGGIIDFDGKADIEDEAVIALDRDGRMAANNQAMCTADWSKFLKEFPVGMKVPELAGFLLQPAISTARLKILDNNSDSMSRTVEILSLPEYQMC